MELNCQDLKAKFENLRESCCENSEINVDIFDGSKRRNRLTNFMSFKEKGTIEKKYFKTDLYQDLRGKEELKSLNNGSLRVFYPILNKETNASEDDILVILESELREMSCEIENLVDTGVDNVKPIEND